MHRRHHDVTTDPDVRASRAPEASPDPDTPRAPDALRAPRSRRPRAARAAAGPLLALALVLALPSRPAAHEIPADVTVLAFVKPEDGRLRLLVRVPLTSMRDVEFPLRGPLLGQAGSASPGYVDAAATRPLLPDLATQWIAHYVRFLEEGRPLEEERVVATRISLPSDRSFDRWETALAHVTGPPLADDVDLVLEQALLDVLLEVPIDSAGARFSVEPAWAHLGLRTSTVLRFLPPGRGERAFQYDGNPGLVRLDPRWHQAALRFVRSGFLHILEGLDHLLFLLCLVIPVRRIAGLVPVVTAFTVAHSITLAASVLGLAPGGLWFPPLIETLIALSIVWMAFENIVGANLQRRWLMAFGFGLVHGFGFSFLLRDTLQFAGGHLVTSLLAFNVGVELGQLAVVVVMVPALGWLFRRVVAERMGVILLSALVAHSAWHWMTERGGELLQYDVAWPALDAATLAAAMRWTLLALVAVGAAWLLFGIFERWSRWAARRGLAAEPSLGSAGPMAPDAGG